MYRTHKLHILSLTSSYAMRIYTCVYLCVCVCVCIYRYTHVYLRTQSTYVSLTSSYHVLTFENKVLLLTLNVRMYACMYVCMYVCVYEYRSGACPQYICVCTYTQCMCVCMHEVGIECMNSFITGPEKVL